MEVWSKFNSITDVTNASNELLLMVLIALIC